MCGLEGVECSELGKDGGLVVACAAGVDAEFSVYLLHDWREGFAGIPLGGCYGLTIVVGVEDDGPLGSGCLDLAEDDGRDGCGEAGSGEELCFGSAQLELADEEFGVSAKAGGVRGNVRNCEKVRELLGE